MSDVATQRGCGQLLWSWALLTSPSPSAKRTFQPSHCLVRWLPPQGHRGVLLDLLTQIRKKVSRNPRKSRTEPKPVNVRFDFARLLLVMNRQWGSFCARSHISKNQHFFKFDYTRTSFLTTDF